MPLGGFAPLPLRLGGNGVEGLSAEQHARIAADMVAMVRSMPFAIVTYTQTGVDVALDAYNGQHGVGINAGPIATRVGLGITDLTWANQYQDPYGTSSPTNIRHAKSMVLKLAGVVAMPTLVAPNIVQIRHETVVGALVDGTATVVVW